MYRLVFTVFFVLSIAIQAHAREVVDAFGERVDIPAQPQRIVVLSEIDLDVALALGVQPVGAVNGRGQNTLPAYLSERIGDRIQPIGDLGNVNLEALIALEPDLILTGQDRPEVIELLRSIAPTVVTFKWGTPWKQTLTDVATILDREEQAQVFKQRYQARVEQARQALDEHQGQSLSIVRWNPKGPAYMHRDAFASRVALELGLTRPSYQQEPGFTHSLSLSLESLELLDADWLVIGTLSSSGEAVDAMRQAKQTPAFAQLSAVRGGRYGTVDGSLWTSVGGPLAAMQVIDDVVALIEGAGETPAPQP